MTMIDQKAADKLDSILHRGWAVRITKENNMQCWAVLIAPSLSKMYEGKWLLSAGSEKSLYDVLSHVENMILDNWDEMYPDLPKDLFGYYLKKP